MKKDGVEAIWSRVREKVPWLRWWHLGAVSAVLLTICISWCMANNINFKVRNSIDTDPVELTERGVMAWLDAFTTRDFAKCDLMIDNQNSRLYNPLMITHSRDNRYYTKALNGIVSCIKSISLVSVEDSEYKFKVCLTRYEPVEKLDVDSVLSLRGRFLNGTMSDSEFNSGLEDLYYEIYSESCFKSSEETIEFIISMSEYQFEGITFVSGTVDFVDLILQESGLTANLLAFESNVKPEVDKMLKSGLDE